MEECVIKCMEKKKSNACIMLLQWKCPHYYFHFCIDIDRSFTRSFIHSPFVTNIPTSRHNNSGSESYERIKYFFACFHSLFPDLWQIISHEICEVEK